MRNQAITIALGGLLAFGAASVWFHKPAAAALPGGGGPFSNQPIALSWDDTLLAVCNPDSGTVTIFRATTNTKLAEPAAGKGPTGVAWAPDGSRLYVALQGNNVVAVIAQSPLYNGAYGVVSTIPVGVEPHGMVLSASGRKLYVTNTRSNTVSVIDITTNQVTATISGVGPEPRGIALTHGASITDANQVVLVTDFLALPSGNGHPDGFDDAKAGFVTAIAVGTDTVIGTIKVQPMADTGFKAAGDALARIAPPANPTPADFTFVTGAYPNQLNNLATHGNFAYLPSTGASPNGPVRFNVNEQSLVSVVNLTTRQDNGQTINIQSAIGAQINPSKLFMTQPWAIAFKNNGDTAYVVSAASNIVVKLAVDPATGKPTVQNDPSDTTRVLEIPVGKNPRGIVINSVDSRAYVWNYVSRDISVIDLTQTPEKVIGTLASSALPQPGTIEDKVHIGKELFFTSVGAFDPPAAGQPAITGRMSNNGWGSCGVCHPNGLTDNVVWIFAAGPRRTVSMHTTFAPLDPSQQRALNWSAIFDEVEDFEGNIRNVSGGQGLFVQADGTTPAPLAGAFTPAASGQKQLSIRGVGGWDAIKEFVARGIPSPQALLPNGDPDVVAGRQLFIQANCQNCHGTAAWTTSRIRYTPPPDPSLIQNGQLIGQLKKVGTFDSTAINEIRATAAPPLGADGFNPPSLLSISAFPQTFFHGGAANSLDEVLNNATHRSAGTGGVDTLSQASTRAQLVKFLLSIDAATVPIFPNASVPTHFAVSAPATVIAGVLFTVTVAALDANDFLVTGYNGKVHFTSSDPAATLPADSNLTQGAGSFTVRLASGPSRTVAATDTANAILTGTSNAITVNPTVLSILGASPGAGSGNSQTFTFTFFNPQGAQGLSVANVLINNFLDGRQACYLAYSVPTNTLFLVDDAGNAGGPFAGSLALGSTATIQNSQCTVGLASTTSTAGTLALTLIVTFKAAFGGNRIAYLAARDEGTGNTGWQAVATWQVPFTPAGAISVNNLNPPRTIVAPGTTGNLSFTVTDTKGTADIGVVNMLINNFIDGRAACYVAYVAASNTLLLVNDAGDGGGNFAGSLTLNGSAATIQNSQCTINGAGSSVTSSGNTMTINLNGSFKGAFAGNRVVYVAARDRSDGNNTDWQALGTATIR